MTTATPPTHSRLTAMQVQNITDTHGKSECREVWSVPTRPYRGPHYAAYPIELPLRCIAAGCRPGGLVLDPFAGTGTTGLAAVQLGRQFTGIDLNPEFVHLAADRLRHAPATAPGGRGGEHGHTPQAS
jgi:DNA modification methylase